MSANGPSPPRPEPRLRTATWARRDPGARRRLVRLDARGDRCARWASASGAAAARPASPCSGVFVLESALFTALLGRLLRAGRHPARASSASNGDPRPLDPLQGAAAPGADRAGDPAAGLPARRPGAARPGGRQRHGRHPAGVRALAGRSLHRADVAAHRPGHLLRTVRRTIRSPGDTAPSPMLAHRRLAREPAGSRRLRQLPAPPTRPESSTCVQHADRRLRSSPAASDSARDARTTAGSRSPWRTVVGPHRGRARRDHRHRPTWQRSTMSGTVRPRSTASGDVDSARWARRPTWR